MPSSLEQLLGLIYQSNPQGMSPLTPSLISSKSRGSKKTRVLRRSSESDFDDTPTLYQDDMTAEQMGANEAAAERGGAVAPLPPDKNSYYPEDVQMYRTSPKPDERAMLLRLLGIG